MAVQIILKNSSIEDKKPTPSQLTNGEISLNYNSAGAFLCCTDTDGNTQQVGGVKIDDSAPDAPVKQTLWFKPSTLTLSVYDGDKWLPIAGGGGGGGGGGDIVQIIGNDGIDADTIAGIVTLDVELAGGDDGLEFKSSKLSASLASATQLGSVKVGRNLEVAAGVISVPPASNTVLGVVKQGDGVEIAADGTISVDVPLTTTYRGKCNLSATPTGQLNPDPAESGDGYLNDTDTASIDVGWSPLTGTAKIGDLVVFDGADWQLFPLGASSAPVTSVNTKIGDVVLTAADVGAATEAQGALADTALQPGDDISELNNDAGYITVAESSVTSVNTKTGDVVLDAADVGALAPGDDVSELANDAKYITIGDVPAQAPPVIISDTAPTDANSDPGDLWFNTNDGRTYVYYEDADSSQWVDASPDGGGSGDDGLWLENAGYLSPKTGTNGVELGSGAITLNATGGSATFAGGNGYNTNDSFGISNKGVLRSRHDDGNFNAFEIYSGGETVNDLTTYIRSDGSSNFAGDMAIGIDGSFTPSTPAITLASEGYTIFNRDTTTDNFFTSYFGNSNGIGTLIRRDGIYIGNPITTGTVNSPTPAGRTIRLGAEGYIQSQYQSIVRTTTNNNSYLLIFSNDNGYKGLVRGDGYYFGTAIDSGTINDAVVADYNAHISDTGNGRFLGDVYVGGTAPGVGGVTAAPNITLSSTGQANFSGAVVCNRAGNASGILVQNSGTTNASISSNGAATFASTITSGDTSGTHSVHAGTNIAFRDGSLNALAMGYSSSSGYTNIFSYNNQAIRLGVSADNIANPSTGPALIGAGAISWSTFSDESMKTDLVPIENGLEKVSTLRAVTGRYLTDETGTSRSMLIAQDVQSVLPEAVSSDPSEDDKLVLRYSEVIPLLVSALHDAKDRLQKADAALLALKTAAVAATDFASLKNAIVTALADV